MKKVLFINPENPEVADTGDKKYTWDILNAIKYCGEVYVHVVSYLEEERRKLGYSKLEKLVDKVTYVPFHRMKPYQMAISKYPAFIAHRKTLEMQSCIKQILDAESFDAIVVNTFKMSWLISTIKDYSGKKIYISHNVEYQVSKSIFQHASGFINRVAYLLDYIKTKYWEPVILSKYDSITAICDCDAELIGEMKNVEEPTVVRPIVDVVPFERLNLHSGKMIICGTFRWLPKKINIQHVLRAKSISLLKSKNKQLMVIGNADESVVSEGNSIDNVFVSGYVESVSPFYQEAEVALIPEQSGGGFKLKIAEAVQYHVPIVAIRGSVTDKQMKNGVHFVEADDFEDLLTKGIELMEDRVKQEVLVKNTLKLFGETYCISAVNRVLNEVLFN